MNDADRREAAYLCTLSSDAAATYVLETYGNTYPSTLARRSWRVRDQLRLARRFLQGRAYSSELPYADFLSFMSFERFLKVVAEGLPDIPDDRLRLLEAYLNFALRRAGKNREEGARVQRLLAAYMQNR